MSAHCHRRFCQIPSQPVIHGTHKVLNVDSQARMKCQLSTVPTLPMPMKGHHSWNKGPWPQTTHFPASTALGRQPFAKIPYQFSKIIQKCSFLCVLFLSAWHKVVCTFGGFARKVWWPFLIFSSTFDKSTWAEEWVSCQCSACCSFYNLPKGQSCQSLPQMIDPTSVESAGCNGHLKLVRSATEWSHRCWAKNLASLLC